MKVYLSGKITGLSRESAEAEFNVARLRALKYLQQVKEVEGYIEIVSPLRIKPFLGIKTGSFHMIADIRAMNKCDTVYHLNNWRNSPGATIEHLVALKRGMNFLYHKDCKQELKYYHKNKAVKNDTIPRTEK